MQIEPVHKDFGVRVLDVDLNTISTNNGYNEIRELFEEYSLLIFEHQNLASEGQLALGNLFGPIEDRENRLEPKIAPVTNVTDDGQIISDEADLKLKQLKSNFLWHTDSTFLPIPALANILQARIIPQCGGETQFVSTRAGFAKLPREIKQQLKEMVFHHSYAQSRQKISKKLARTELITMWADTAWKAVFKNPVNGKDALYIASHVFKVDDWSVSDSDTFIEELVSLMTEPFAIYSHSWKIGDVLIWDERATLHRGTPWHYEEPRKLESVCVSLQDSDGLESIRVSN